MSRAKSEETRMPLTSSNVVDERLEQLREVFPEVFREGKVDFERLPQSGQDDQLKTNTVLEMKSKEIVFQTV